MGMSLEELRKRSERTKAQQDAKISRVREAVVDVVQSGSFALSALNQLGNDENNENEVEQLASAIASKVTEVITDPKIEFLDTLRARGLKETRIKTAVQQLNMIFGLTSSQEYDDQLEAVALYLRDRPNLYDDIALLT